MPSFDPSGHTMYILLSCIQYLCPPFLGTMMSTISSILTDEDVIAPKNMNDYDGT